MPVKRSVALALCWHSPTHTIDTEEVPLNENDEPRNASARTETETPAERPLPAEVAPGEEVPFHIPRD